MHHIHYTLYILHLTIMLHQYITQLHVLNLLVCVSFICLSSLMFSFRQEILLHHHCSESLVHQYSLQLSVLSLDGLHWREPCYFISCSASSNDGLTFCCICHFGRVNRLCCHVTQLPAACAVFYFPHSSGRPLTDQPCQVGLYCADSQISGTLMQH